MPEGHFGKEKHNIIQQNSINLTSCTQTDDKLTNLLDYQMTPTLT